MRYRTVDSKELKRLTHGNCTTDKLYPWHIIRINEGGKDQVKIAASCMQLVDANRYCNHLNGNL